MPEYTFTPKWVDRKSSKVEDATTYAYDKVVKDVTVHVAEQVYKVILADNGETVRPYGETKTAYLFFERKLVPEEKPEK